MNQKVAVEPLSRKWQANAFAGELMAPYNLVKNMDPYEISAKCGMSLKAAQIQYNEYRK